MTELLRIILCPTLKSLSGWVAAGDSAKRDSGQPKPLMEQRLDQLDLEAEQVHPKTRISLLKTFFSGE